MFISSSEKIEITCGAGISEIISSQLELFFCPKLGLRLDAGKRKKRMTKV